MKLLYKYHFLFLWLIVGICFLSLFEFHYTSKPIEIIHIPTFLDNDFYIGGQPLNTGGTAFHWWLLMAYRVLWWQAVGFTIVWLLKLPLIEWLTIAHILIFLVLFFGFSSYVLVAEQPKTYSIIEPLADIINWIFISGLGLMILNIVLSLIRKLF